MPPIENVDPFEDDDTGAFFKKYPYHRELRRQWGRLSKQDLLYEIIDM